MKLAFKSLALATVITASMGVQAFAIQMGSGSTGSSSTDCYCPNVYGTHEIGVKRSTGVFDTYGFSWVISSNHTLETTTKIGTVSKSATGYGSAQTNTFSASGTNLTVSESHKQI